MRLIQWWCEPLPPERLALTRVIVITFQLTYVLVMLPLFADAATFVEGYRPVGIFSVVAAPLSASLFYAILVGFGACGVAAAVGWRFRVTGPAFALLHLVLFSYRNCWGYIVHMDKLATIHVLILGVSRAADAVSVDARRRVHASGSIPPAGEDYGWPLKLMAVVTLMTYFIAGVTKVRYGGVQWISGDVVRNFVGWVALRNELLHTPRSPIGPHLLGFSGAFKAMAAFAMLVELGAPLALLRRVRAPWIVCALVMHWGILLVMMVPFPYYQFGIAYVPLLPIEEWRRSFARVRQASRGRSGVRAGDLGRADLEAVHADAVDGGKTGASLARLVERP